MGMIFYFMLALLESSFLLWYAASIKSAPEEAVLWGFSGDRLFLILVLAVLTIVFLCLLFLAVRRARGYHTQIETWLSQDIIVMWGIFSSLFSAFMLFMLLIQEPPFFGNVYPIYTRLRPFITWAFVMCIQSFTFLLVWYGLRFIEVVGEDENEKDQTIHAVLIGVFLLLILIKVILVFPSSFGLIKRFGESKYILMAQIFTEGVRLSSYNNPVIFHYPFLYPITLSFPWQIENHAFTAIRLLNAIFTASAIFPVYLLARQLMEGRKALLIAVLSGILPFQFLIPIQVLSENLYIPLFLWTVFFIFSIPTRSSARLPWDILTAIFIGLLYLARYITLAVIPFLLVLWWFKPFGNLQKIFRFSPRKLAHLIIIIICIAALYTPWVLFARAAGLSFEEAFGFGITANTNAQQLSFGNLIKWLLLYLAYYILMLAPFLGLLFSIGKYQIREYRVKRWLIMVIVLSLAFLLPIVRHSWRASYNSVLPSRIMGRYIIFLPPLFLIAAFLPFSIKPKNPAVSNRSNLLRSVLLPLGLVILSYFLLIGEAFIPVKKGFISPFAAYDVYYLKLMGVWLWPFLLLIYLIPLRALCTEKPCFILKLMAFLLAFYFTFALPSYLNEIHSAQYYERLGSQIVSLVRSCGLNASGVYKVYLPDTIDATNRADVDWSIRIHNLSALVNVLVYSPGQPIDPSDFPTIIVKPIMKDKHIVYDAPYTCIFDEVFIMQLFDPGEVCH
jgi:hypothetical protein